MGFQNPKTVVNPLPQKGEHGSIRCLRERPQEAVRRHVACQFMIVPEEPTQDFEVFILTFSSKASMSPRQAQENRCGLG
jgi:hypothetical protein